MRSILRFNLGVIGLFLIGLLIVLLTDERVVNLPGLVLFFLPGLNLAYLFEQVTGRSIGFLRIGLLAILLSVSLNPLIYYLVGHQREGLPSLLTNSEIFLSWLGVTLALLLLAYRWRRLAPTPLRLESSIRRPLFWVIAVTVMVMIGHFLLYRYVPEADGYDLIRSIEQMVATKLPAYSGNRPTFIYLLYELAQLTVIPPYWLFKAVLPLVIAVGLTGTYFTLANDKARPGWRQSLTTLGWLSFPVVVLEVLIIRPQSVFLLALPIYLYFLAYWTEPAQRRQPSNFWWLVLLLLSSVLSVKTHPLFLASTVLIGVAMLVFAYPYFRRQPIRTGILAVLVLSWLAPFLIRSGSWERLVAQARLIGEAFGHLHFNFWFIDSYHNIDGSQLGWPGWTAALYYGYNLGLLLLGIALIWLWRRPRLTGQPRPSWVYIVGLIFFFAFAEVLPRFGVAYLPDRAWLLLALSLGFLLPTVLEPLGNQSPQVKKLLMMALVASIVSGGAITYFKRGWVSPDEYAAAHFLATQTQADAIIITQQGNSPLIRYFGHRTPVSDPALFSADTPDRFKRVLSQEEHAQPAEALASQARLQALLAASLADTANSERLTAVRALLEQLSQYQNQLLESQTTAPEPTKPIFVLYSTDKFTGLYGGREWWRRINYQEADLNLFADHPDHFRLVYQNKAVRIWQYQP